MNKKSKVILLPCSSYREEIVYENLEIGLELLGGIEKIVKKLDQRLKIEHGQDIHPSESAVILTKECKEVAARQMQWGFPGF